MDDGTLRNSVDRLSRLYTGAVADVMDEMGYRQQCLPPDIRPLETGQTLAGVAFTIRGRALTTERDTDPRYLQIEMLEAVIPQSVVVLDPGDETKAAHWGELMSATAQAAGCLGAVINGGLRDTRQIRSLGFPVFGRYFSPLTAVWRWELTDFQTPILLNDVAVTPGDFILADDDGVLCIPRPVFSEVLDRAEEIVAKERLVHQGLHEGARIRDLFEEHRVF